MTKELMLSMLKLIVTPNLEEFLKQTNSTINYEKVLKDMAPFLIQYLEAYGVKSYPSPVLFAPVPNEPLPTPPYHPPYVPNSGPYSWPTVIGESGTAGSPHPLPTAGGNSLHRTAMGVNSKALTVALRDKTDAYEERQDEVRGRCIP